jgi:hypothetical protein
VVAVIVAFIGACAVQDSPLKVQKSVQWHLTYFIHIILSVPAPKTTYVRKTCSKWNLV